MLYINNNGESFSFLEDVITNDDTPSDGASCADYDNDGDLDLLVNNVNDEIGSRDTAEVFSATLLMDYDLGFATFTSLTGYKDHTFDYAEDFDGTPLRINDYAQDQDGDYFEQELRLVSKSDGNFEWVVGGYYNYKRRDVDYFYRSNLDFLAASGITGLPDAPYYSKFQ